MKSKNPILLYFLGGSITFVSFVLIFVLFQKWNLFDFYNRTLKSIILEALFISIIFSFIMFLYSNNRMKKRKYNQEKK